ncbi:MAG: hypothetical protein HYS22_02715 [Deltaproteobacteria bacterium]|nr:hypothetical protein [Deltaproteobacteria bacterium]
MVYPLRFFTLFSLGLFLVSASGQGLDGGKGGGGCGWGYGGESSGESGIVGDGNSVSVSVGGTLSGLSGTVVLQNNGGDDLTLTANGPFTFPSELPDGTSYTITVSTQPATQTCSVARGVGTIKGANVTNVSVVCSKDTYSVGGTLSGLSGTVVLQNNSGDNLTLTANGSFTFPTVLADGADYAVTILTQPSGQTCAVSSASGTMSGANVTGVTVACANNIIMFGTGGAGGGNLGGRAGADALCTASVGSLSCNTIRAFISVSDADEIRDMPGNYGVPTTVAIQGSTGTKIANNWEDLLDGTIPTSLATAGITDTTWWSGSTTNGSLSNNCSNWTTSSFVAPGGQQAFANVTDSNWISQSNQSCAVGALVVLCLCY